MSTIKAFNRILLISCLQFYNFACPILFELNTELIMRNFTLKRLKSFKPLFFVVLFLFSSFSVFSQYSTKHYIAAAPWDYSSDANEFVISCPSGTASVTITKSDGTAITTMSVTSGSPVAFRPTGIPATKPANAINTIYNDRGLIFTSTLPIAVSIRNIESDQVNGGRPAEIKGNASLASYGNEAIGSSFRVGYYRTNFTGLYAYAPTGFPAATAAPVYSVMAIDNNTVVSINGTVLVTLNAGQCYLFQTAIGSLISSTKPVVMNSGQWRDTPTGCGDSVLNEIPPVRVLGTNYLVVRGSGTTRGTSTNLNFPEQTVFIATEDNTRVTVNTVDTAGTITATNNYLLPTAGSYQSIFHGIDGVKYSASIISADKKIIVYSGTAQSCEVDMACVAPISPCTGSYSVETIKFLTYNNTTLKYFGYVLVNDASAPVFINGVNLETLTSTSRYQIGSSGYYIMRFTNTQLGDPTNLVFTSSVRMSLSMVQSEGGFSMASYLSSYNDNATQQFAPTINGSGCVSTLTAEPGLEPYQWYLNDVLIPGATNQTYVPTETGSYSVAGIKECGLSVASTPVVINCIPIDAVNDGSSLSPFATVISGSTLPTSVMSNDFINGVAATTSNTTITPKTQGPLTINAAGIITVASGTVNGVYPIEYELCSTLLSPTICDKATAYVKVTVLPGSIASDRTICSGGDPAAFTSTSNGVGVGTITYRWESAVSPFTTWNTISGQTATTYDVPSGLIVTTSYRRIAISTLGESDPTAPVTVTVNPLPTTYAVTGGGAFCSGGTGVAVGLANSQTGINYQLKLGGVNNGAAVTGTGSAISFGNKTTAGTYTVVATNATTGCTVAMTGSVSVSINSLPISYAVTGGGAFCSGGTGVAVGLANSQTGINYQLQLGGVNDGSVVAGTGSAFSFGNKTAAGTYTVIATNATTGCTVAMTGSVLVSINSLPISYTVTGGGAFCSGGTGVAVGLANSQTGINYQLQLGGVNDGSVVAGTGSTISFGNKTTAGTYTVVATNATTGCTVAMTGSVGITINAAPAAPTAPVDVTVCETGSSQTLTATATVPSGSSIVWYDAATGGNVVNPATLVSTTASTLTLYGQTSNGTCSSLTRTAVVLTINAAPAAPTAPVDVTVCETGSSQTLTATATVPSGSSIVWYDAATGGNVVNPATLVSTTASTLTLYGQTSNGTCSSLTRTAVVLTINAAPAAPTVSVLTQATCAFSKGSVLLSGLPSGIWMINPVSISGNTPSWSIFNLSSGTYSYTVTNSVGCTSLTTADIIISNVICANDDNIFPAQTPSTTVATTVGNVTDNDTLNGVAVTASNTDVTPITTGPLSIDADGVLSLAPNTITGTYTITYQLCEVGAMPTNCDTAVATVVVGNVIDAVLNNTFPAQTPSTTVATTVGNVTDNDTLNGVAVTVSNTDVTPIATGPLSIDANGVLSLAPNTTTGTYTITYQLCEVGANPANCDTAVATVVVGNVIDAVLNNTFPAQTPSTTVATTVGNVTDNDTLNGVAVTASNTDVTPIITGPLSIDANGVLSLAPNTTTGTYTITYQLCEVGANPANCDTAVATVVVGNVIDAVLDNTFPAQTPSTTVTTTVGNVTDNDTLNGVAVTVSNTDVTPITTGPLSIDANGVLSLAPNTTTGTYTITYQLCEVGASPANCATSTVTVVVSAPLIDAVTETTPSINGLTGGTTATLVGNDTLNGSPVVIGSNPGQVTLVGLAVPTGLTLNADGTVSVAPNTPAGNYNVVYRICEVTNPSNCDTVTSVVVVNTIDAKNDALSTIIGAFGGTTENILLNDSLNGVVLTAATLNTVVVTRVGVYPSGITINADGTLNVAPGTAVGNYILEYQICSLALPTLCDTASITIQIITVAPPPSPAPPAIFADTDLAGPIVSNTTAQNVLNVLSNDFIELTPATVSNVVVSTVTADPTGFMTLQGDGTIVLGANIPAGTYTLTYSICEIVRPTNCTTATVTIIVDKPSIALVKTAKFNDENGDGYSKAGETITYSFEVTNTGNTILTNVTISDPLPGVVMSGFPLTLGIGESNSTHFQGVYTIKQSDINSGSISNQATVYGTAPSGLVVEDKSDDSNLVNDNPTVLSVSGCAVKVFNAVSPDGNGQNDRFYILGLECYPENSIEIFNRWGVLVFERDQYNNEDKAFRGISEGRVTLEKSSELPVGTYFYILKYKDSGNNSFEKSGYLYLNRK
ncbi:Ig-like domain CHU_C associated [Flavobacteriaceae bacterium]